MSKTDQWKSYLLGHHEFRELALDALFVDPAYQRELNAAAIKRYVHGFDANMFEPLTVNERKSDNGHGPTYALLDGQHRKAMAQTLGNKTVTCRVLHVDAATEADLFIRLNKDRIHLTPVSAFKAELAAKNPAALEILKCLEDRHLSVAKKEDTESITAVVALKTIYARGGFVRLGKLLDTIILSWPAYEPSRFMGQLMLGIDEFLGSTPPNGATVLPEKLARTTPEQILAKANSRWHAHRALGNRDKSIVNCVAEQVGTIYRSTRRMAAA